MGCRFCVLVDVDDNQSEIVSTGINEYDNEDKKSQLEIEKKITSLANFKIIPNNTANLHTNHTEGEREIILPTINTEETNAERLINLKEIVMNQKLKDYDYDEHSRKIFVTLNKIRGNPNRYLKKISHLISHIDRDTNSILIQSENVNILLPENIDPTDAVAFLETQKPESPLLWSNLLYNQAYEDLTTTIEAGSNNLLEGRTNFLLGKNMEIIKITASFIADPKISAYLLFIISEENRNLLFSSEIFEAAIVALPRNYTVNSPLNYSNEGVTLMYFAKSK